MAEDGSISRIDVPSSSFISGGFRDDQPGISNEDPALVSGFIVSALVSHEPIVRVLTEPSLGRTEDLDCTQTVLVFLRGAKVGPIDGTRIGNSIGGYSALGRV